MYKRNANISFIVFVIISIAEITVVLNLFKLDNNIVTYISIAYILIAIIVSFLLLRFIKVAEKHKPKEEVKIIYKNFDKEKADQEFIEKKSKNKARKIAETFIEDLNKYTDKEKFTEVVLNKLSKNFHIVQGIFYLWDEQKQEFYTANSYAFYTTETNKAFTIGEGITGQVAKNKKFLLINNVPKDYVKVVSGLGEGTPKYLAFLPIISNEKTIGIIEFASFVEFPTPTDEIFTTLAGSLAKLIQKFV